MEKNPITIEEINKIDFSIQTEEQIQALAERINEVLNEPKRHELLYVAIDSVYDFHNRKGSHDEFYKNVLRLVKNRFFKNDIKVMYKETVKNF